MRRVAVIIFLWTVCERITNQLKVFTVNYVQVIKTLKRALQPMISNLEITWNLAEGWSVHQIPSSLPTVFMGDRLVVYGILRRPPETSQSVEKDIIEHRVSLQGSVPQDTTKVDHSVTFSTELTKCSTSTA